MNQLLFTPVAVFDLLSQLDELKDREIELNETENMVEIKVGESTYTINSDDATQISVLDEMLSEVAEISDNAYNEVEEKLAEADEVAGGLLKGLAKTLLVGGLVRLTSKLLKK